MFNMHSLLFHIFFLLSLLSNTIAVPSHRPPGCPSRCGNVEIPYPFGIGPYCSMDWNFEIICLNSSNPPKPYLEIEFRTYEVEPVHITYQFEVVNISETQIYVKNSTLQLAMACYGMEQDPNKTDIEIDLSSSPYSFSHSNQITVIGCDDLALVESNRSYTNSSVAAVSYCTLSNTETYSASIGSCANTYGCFRAFISKGVYLKVRLMDAHIIWSKSKAYPCSLAFVGMKDVLDFTYPLTNLNAPETFQNSKEFMYKPLVLDWRIVQYITINLDPNNEYQLCQRDINCSRLDYLCQKNSLCINLDDSFGGVRCKCKEGYKGNPYNDSGCQG
ncbi:wall-associated receptor kinase 2-like [Olea europaea subsp. europaea]|uniref:Wall-associated receptor kinase 2-like n=1 Tax=Olea europaea subsp. europaea TaxID=158383 RepID=A0A8S0UCZ9_OLEEU|nr:wall-associated receptor kinase 2-like [Olea europaea subsp. europaea]